MSPVLLCGKGVYLLLDHMPVWIVWKLYFPGAKLCWSIWFVCSSCPPVSFYRQLGICWNSVQDSCPRGKDLRAKS
jgi:hypothetical protein